MNTDQKKPSMPWYVSAGGEIQGQFRSEAATYRHVKDLVGLGRDCEVWHWDKRDGWVLFERIEAAAWARVLARRLTPAAEDDTRSQPGTSGSAGEDKSRQGPGLPGATATRGAQPPPPQVPSAGDPCPNGCTTDYRRKIPELLTMNIDREVSCPTCWDCFGIAP